MMKQLIKYIEEGILAGMEDTLDKGETISNDILMLYNTWELGGIAGYSNWTDKMFDESKLQSFVSQPFKSDAMHYKILPHRTINHLSFGKWLEQLTPDKLGYNTFSINSMSDAEEFATRLEKYAKKEGVIKNKKDIRIRGKYFSSHGGCHTQFQLNVERLDKNGDIKKVKRNGIDESVYLMYVFIK